MLGVPHWSLYPKKISPVLDQGENVPLLTPLVGGFTPGAAGCCELPQHCLHSLLGWGGPSQPLGTPPTSPVTVTPCVQEPFQVWGALPARRQVQPPLEQQPEQPKSQRFAEPQQVGVSGARETTEARSVARRGGETEKVREGKSRGQPWRGGGGVSSPRAVPPALIPVLFLPFQG